MVADIVAFVLAVPKCRLTLPIPILVIEGAFPLLSPHDESALAFFISIGVICNPVSQPPKRSATDGLDESWRQIENLDFPHAGNTFHAQLTSPHSDANRPVLAAS